MKKLLKFCLIATLCMSFLNFTPAVYATDTETTTEESFDLWGQLAENFANAKVEDDELAEINEELYGDPNYNPLTNAKESIKKFINAFSKKEYDKNDFGGKADEVYGGITDGANEIVDSDLLDSIYGVGTSILNLIMNIISSIGEMMA